MQIFPTLKKREEVKNENEGRKRRDGKEYFMTSYKIKLNWQYWNGVMASLLRLLWKFFLLEFKLPKICLFHAVCSTKQWTSNNNHCRYSDEKFILWFDGPVGNLSIEALFKF